MWECPKCGEGVDEPFDVCWACGTSRDGVEDPTFRLETDSPKPWDAEAYGRGVRGLAAGAIIAAVAAFLSPGLILLVDLCFGSSTVGSPAVLWLLRFGSFSAPFAALGGAVAGAVGARTKNEGRAVATGALGCLFCHALFLVTATNAFTNWPRETTAGSLAMAALAGCLAGHAGVVAGRRHARRRGRNDTPSASRS